MGPSSSVRKAPQTNGPYGIAGQRVRGVAREIPDDPVRHVGRRGDDRVVGRDLRGDALANEPHPDAVRVGHDLLDGRARQDAIAQPVRERLRQELRAADQVAGRPGLVVAPHQREERGAAAGRDLLRLGRDPLGDGPEDRRHVRMELAQVGGEGLVVPVREHAGPPGGRRLARARANGADVLLGRRPQPEPRPHEGQARPPGERETEGIGLRAPAGHHPAPEREAHPVARDAPRLEAHLRHEPVHEGARAAEEVGPEVQPVRPAGLGAHPAADAVGRFQHQELPVPERPPGGEPGDAAAHDHGLVASLGHRSPPVVHVNGVMPAHPPPA